MTKIKELTDFWNKLKESEIKLKDIDKLQELLSSVYLKMSELEKSRDRWKEKYEELKGGIK